MPDANAILIEAARGALAFFQLEAKIKAAHDPAMLERDRARRRVFSSCVGKVRFETLTVAQQVQRRRMKVGKERKCLKDQRPYKCPGCGGWHIGADRRT